MPKIDYSQSYSDVSEKLRQQRKRAGLTQEELAIRAHVDSSTRWICRCDCGRVLSVLSESLRTGKSTSCGCKLKALKHDLTGMEFGYLLVLGVAPKSRYQSNETRWKCKCQNCGRIVDVASRTLRTGNPYGHCRCTRMKKK